jgi:uncharacterized protein (DUF952 family)
LIKSQSDVAIIFHITEREVWDSAQSLGAYQPEMFAADGFIHCSKREQVIQVANARFRGQTGLVILSIDTDGVIPRIVFENLEGGEQLFPHIYGELNTDAVVRVTDFAPAPDGYFRSEDL